MDWLVYFPEIFIALGVIVGIIARLARQYSMGELDRKVIALILGAALLSWITALAMFPFLSIDPHNYRMLLMLGAVVGLSGDTLTAWLIENGLNRLKAMLEKRHGDK